MRGCVGGGTIPSPQGMAPVPLPSLLSLVLSSFFFSFFSFSSVVLGGGGYRTHGAGIRGWACFVS